LFEHIAIAVLAAALLVTIIFIVYWCKKKAFQRIHQNIVEPTAIPTKTDARDFKLEEVNEEIN
jgi:hypothetical protein